MADWKIFTLCLGALPYLSSVLLLPIIVFSRCYSLCFIEQFGPTWRIFRHGDWAAECTSCGYDLTGLPTKGACPECGMGYAAPEASTDELPSMPPTSPAS